MLQERVIYLDGRMWSGDRTAAATNSVSSLILTNENCFYWRKLWGHEDILREKSAV